MKRKCMKKKKVLKNSSKNCILIYMFLNNSLYLADRELNILGKHTYDSNHRAAAAE